ncbi:hypothetical protein [uncultured Winogradskyella sp.]|uniref:hypothetical protein n=1 Tax=uncultured Winogradskyella sp. TaxID=395353 RepID=UPI00260A4E17|nr:hypothetical protein [uncultured Winogradskyella sp.]
MINPKELRIDRYYHSEGLIIQERDKPTTITTTKDFLMTKEILIDVLTSPYNYDISPISLTEQWLLDLY